MTPYAAADMSGLVRCLPARLLLAAGVLVCGIVVLLNVMSPPAASPARGLLISERKLRDTIARLKRTDVCLLPNGRSLPLGAHSVWGEGGTGARSVSGEGATGGPVRCIFCECAMATLNSPAASECFVHSCPSSACSPEYGEYEPTHPCCSVCAPEAAQKDVAETAHANLTIDPSVPLTGAIYRSQFRHVPSRLCDAVAVLAITSTPRAAARRALLRRLYQTEASSAGIRLVFLLGRDAIIERAYNDFSEEDFEFVYPDAEAEVREEREARSRTDAAQFPGWQRAVDAEAARHDDILQSDVTEHYFHLGLKTVSLLDAVRRCAAPPLRFVAKADDDVLVNMHQLAAAVGSLSARRAIHGKLGSLSVSRSSGGWFSSEREWPWRSYKRFVLGPGYLVSADAAGELFAEALRTPYHHLEDVFVTGIVAEAAGVERHAWSGQCGNALDLVGLCGLTRCAFTHKVNYDLWGEALGELLNASRRFDWETLCLANDTSQG